MKHIALLIALLLLGCATEPPTALKSAHLGAGGASAGPPNILLIIADDLGAESSSLYPELVGDSGAVPMPNLEGLASQGLRFTQAWVNPACTQTRASIVTGQYGHHTGATYVEAVVPTSTVTVFDRITADAPDYAQAMFGKYHLGGRGSTVMAHVVALGVPTFRGMIKGPESYFNWILYEPGVPNKTITTYSTTKITDLAIDYITAHEATRPNDPWFVYQAYNAPHEPHQVPPSALHSVDLGGALPGQTLNTLPTFKAMTQSLDAEMGRLLSHVDLADTTVIFIGDNGTTAGKKDTGTGVRDSKASVFEGGVRVPLVVAGAGVTRTGDESALVQAPDLYATILALAGLPVTQEADSLSFAALLSDPDAPKRAHAFTETANADGSGHKYAIRDGRSKLLWNGTKYFLYDLQIDPLETSNKFNNAAYASQKASLLAALAPIIANAPPQYFP